MEDVLQVLNEFQGIIGAILGTVATLIVTDILKKKGKLKIYISKYNAKYDSYKNAGCFSDGDEKTRLYSFSMKYTIQVYNQSDSQKIMRDFHLVFKEDRQEIYSIVPKDEVTRRYSSHISSIDDMEISNISPREIQVLDHSFYFLEKEMHNIEGANLVELQYKDEKNKKRKFAISKDTISRNKFIPEED